MSEDVGNYSVECAVMTRAGEIPVQGVRLRLDDRQEIGYSDDQGNFPQMPLALSQSTFKLVATYQNAAEHLKKEELIVTVSDIDPAAGLFDATVSNTIKRILDVAGHGKIVDAEGHDMRDFSQQYSINMCSPTEEVSYDPSARKFTVRIKLATLSLNVPYFNQNAGSDTVRTIPGKDFEPSAKDVTPVFNGGILCFPTSVRMLLDYWGVKKDRREIMQETYRQWAETGFDGVLGLYGRRDRWKTTFGPRPTNPTPWQRWLNEQFVLQEWEPNKKEWRPIPDQWRVEKPVEEFSLSRLGFSFHLSFKKFGSQLKAGPLAPEWRQEFKAHNIEFSKVHEPNVTKQGGQWQIEDTDSQKNFMVFHEGFDLNIYDANAWRDFASELDDGKVSEALCTAFKNSPKSLKVTTQAYVDVKEPGKKWIVVDAAASYFIWKNQKLDVYKINWDKIWVIFEYERKAVENFKPDDTDILTGWFGKVKVGALPPNIFMPAYTKLMLEQLEKGLPMVVSTTATDGHIMIIRGAVVDKDKEVKWLIVNDPYGTLAGPDSIYLELGGSVGKKSKNPKITNNDPEDVKAVQQALKTAGYWKGPIDGKCDGTDSDPLVKAIMSFEKDKKMKPSGTVERGGSVLRALNAFFYGYKARENENNTPNPLDNKDTDARGKHVYYDGQIHGGNKEGKFTIKGTYRGVVMLTRKVPFEKPALTAKLTPGA